MDSIADYMGWNQIEDDDYLGQEKIDYRYWIVKGGGRILITEMKNDHLKNAINSSKKHKALSHWTPILEKELYRRSTKINMINLKKIKFNYHKYTRTLFIYIDEPNVYCEPKPVFSEKMGEVMKVIGFRMTIRGKNDKEFHYTHSHGRRDYYKNPYYGDMLIIKKNHSKEKDITKLSKFKF